MKIEINNVLKVKNKGIRELYDILKENDANGKFLFVTEPNLDKLYGDEVKKQLQELGDFELEYIDESSIKKAMDLASKLIEEEIDYVIGLGGGKILDVCKYASYIAKKCFVSLPTTLANDGIASPIAVLKMANGKVKSLQCEMAKIIIIDTTIMLDCPSELIKAGIGDTLANYMALLDWKFACDNGKDKMNDFAYMLSQESYESLLNAKSEKFDEKFIKVLANSIILSGLAMQFTGSSRPVSGSEHLFSHALDYYGKTPNLHGLQVALGTIAMLKLIGEDYHLILNFFKKYDVNINPQRLNISKDDFVLCMQKAVTMRKRYTYLNEINFTQTQLEKIYDELLEEL